MGLRSYNKPSAGVSGFAVKRSNYSPALDTPSQPARTGSMDAFTKPSKDFGGNTRPYWASKGD